VTSIGDGTFESCEKLAGAVFQGETPPITIGSDVFDSCADDFTIWVPDSSVANYNAVANLSAYTISTAEMITEGENFSYGDLQYTVTSADSKTAAVTGYTEANENIVIPEFVPYEGNILSVTSIGADALQNDSYLMSVTIPASVASIGASAFSGCTGLTDVVLNGKVSSAGASAFDGGEATLTFAVPDGTVNYYKNMLTSDVMGSTTAEVTGTKLISEITDLPAAKRVINGTAQDELSLPDTLTVTADGVQEAIDVTWTSNPVYHASTAGTYTFTPVLPSGYALGDGVGAVVKVTVASAVSNDDSYGTVTIPVSSGSGTIRVSASISGNTATVKVTDPQLQKIASGNESARTVKIDVSALKADTVIIPSDVISAADSDSGSTCFEVTLPAGTIALDNDALSSVADKGNVKFSVETVTNSELSDTQKAVLGTQAETAFIVNVNIFANGNRTSTFGDGKIKVSIPYTPKSGENTDSITVWFMKDDGTIEPKNGTYNAATGCVAFTTGYLSQYLIVSFPFADVAEDAWYYGSVAYAYNNSIFAGTSTTTFSPDTAMTRQMIWMVLARMDGNTPANMEEACGWAMENGISDGTNPTNVITREQMAAILYRYAQHKDYDTTQGGMAIREFMDYNSISEYALPALTWAVNAELVQGSCNKVMPSRNTTRAQVVTILQRFFQNIVK
jgi:hypothetical protein